MRLLLARHGETGRQYQGRYIGSSDLPLSSEGRDQARRLGLVLPTRIPRCFCSPMRRTRETLGLALAGRDSPVEMLDELREIDFGRWEGLSFSEIASQDPELVEAWLQNPESFQFPGGESTAQFLARVQNALTAISRLPESMVLLVCHGGTIRACICALLGLSFSHYLSFAVEPAALSVLDITGDRGVLRGLNIKLPEG